MQSSRVVLRVPYGAPAIEALGGLITDAQTPDHLAPVTVVTPSAHVAVTLRRHLSSLSKSDGRRGLLNVQWTSLPQMTDVLARRSLIKEDRAELTDVIRRAAIRGALDEDPGRFAPVLNNASTENRLDLTFSELQDLDDGDLDAVAQISARSHDLVRLLRAFRVRSSDFADQRDVCNRAGAAIAEGSAALDALGHVIAYLPTRFSRSEQRMLCELARIGRLTVLLGLTGDPSADSSVERLAESLCSDLSTSVHEVTADASPAAPDAHTTFVRAPDADEEVRVAVRTVVRALEKGLAPDDIAIASRAVNPYAGLLHEHLSACGIRHHGPSLTSLAQSVAGRALLGFLATAKHEFGRSELFRWVRSAPIRFPEGRPVPPQFDRLARRAGVGRGIDQWHQRLTQLKSDQLALPQCDQATLGHIDGLVDFVDSLSALSIPPTEATWAAFARWGEAVLEALLGDRSKTLDWPESDQDAYGEVGDVLAKLSALDAIEPNVDLDRFERVLESELSLSARTIGSFGHGVFVGSLADLAGARHELVIVLGMAEGVFPPSGAEDSLLPDAERRSLGGLLADRRPSRSDEKRGLLAAISSATWRELSFARVDGRGHRELAPSRFFLEELSRGIGEYVGFDELDQIAARPIGDDQRAVLMDVASFQSGAMTAHRAMSCQEHSVVQLLRGAAPDTGLRAGLAAVADRVAGRFSEWTGHAGPEFAPRFTKERVGSSTSFEQWATCPFRYFLDHVLGVRPFDTFGDADMISALDRGSFVHEVLENFVGENTGRPADEAWTSRDRDRLREIANSSAERMQAEGRAGRPLLWDLQLETLLRRLEIVLDEDGRRRLLDERVPMAVEFVFAAVAADAPALEFILSSGRVVSFRGAIDRVDREPNSGRLVVLDYKTGSSKGYGELETDITCRGRHLQLVIYGEAARRQFGGDKVDAFYWFVENKPKDMMKGGPIDDDRRQRFLDVLEVIVAGIEDGKFPANPGEPNFFGFSHCGFCDFNRVCPSSRDDLWEGVRLSGAISNYVSLAEPEFVGSAPGAGKSDG